MRYYYFFCSGALEDDLESSLPIKLSVSCNEESDDTIIYNWQVSIENRLEACNGIMLIDYI